MNFPGKKLATSTFGALPKGVQTTAQIVGIIGALGLTHEIGHESALPQNQNFGNPLSELTSKQEAELNRAIRPKVANFLLHCDAENLSEAEANVYGVSKDHKKKAQQKMKALVSQVQTSIQKYIPGVHVTRNCDDERMLGKVKGHRFTIDEAGVDSDWNILGFTGKISAKIRQIFK